MFRHEKLAPRRALEIVRLDRLAEVDRGGALPAEDDHVREVGGVGADVWGDFAERGLAVEAAGGEDGFDGCDGEAGGGEEEVACVVDSNSSMRFKEFIQVLEEFDGEQVDWFGAAGEDVVDDVVEFGDGSSVELICIQVVDIGEQLVNIDHCVCDDRVVLWHAEVGGGVFFDYRVDFHDGGVDSMLYECGWGCADSQTDDQGVSVLVRERFRDLDQSNSLEHRKNGVDRLLDFRSPRQQALWKLEPLPTKQTVITSQDSEILFRILEYGDVTRDTVLSGQETPSICHQS